jgi:hypothetical protein
MVGVRTQQHTAVKLTVMQKLNLAKNNAKET